MEQLYDNESENNWNKIVSFVKDFLPEIYKLKTFIITDGDKVFTEELKSTIPKVKIFVC